MVYWACHMSRRVWLSLDDPYVELLDAMADEFRRSANQQALIVLEEALLRWQAHQLRRSSEPEPSGRDDVARHSGAA